MVWMLFRFYEIATSTHCWLMTSKTSHIQSLQWQIIDDEQSLYTQWFVQTSHIAMNWKKALKLQYTQQKQWT
jgi:hypothetical protein